MFASLSILVLKKDSRHGYGSGASVVELDPRPRGISLAGEILAACAEPRNPPDCVA